MTAAERHFTGKERDSESGNDYFEARYYSSAMGRFMRRTGALRLNRFHTGGWPTSAGAPGLPLFGDLGFGQVARSSVLGK